MLNLYFHWITGANTCGLTDQCCGMDKENCCMNDKPINNQPGQPQQTYTVWERQCDNEQQLDCPVSVMKKCYPIRVPNCRTVTDIKRRTFQVNKLLLNLFQKHLFLHQLTHNTTKDCSLNYKFSTWKLQAQNMGRTQTEHVTILTISNI